MADNPLVTFWNDTLTQAKNDKSNADAQLQTAQADLKARRDALAAATAAYKAAQQKLVELRAKLAAIPTGDDGAALLDQFRQATLDAHEAKGKQVAAEAQLAQAISATAGASSVVSAASARVAATTAALVEAQQPAAGRNALKDAAGRVPLKNLKADAGKAATSPPFTDAQKRIQSDFPPSLLAAAEARFQQETARVSRARAAQQAAENLIASGDTAAGSARLALTRAAATLQDTALNGPRNLTEAGRTLTAVADPSQAKLTDDEVAAIQGLKPDKTPDDTINTPRNEAAGAAKDLANADRALDDAQSAVDDARLKARANGVDPSKIDDDTDVKKALTALQTASAARDAANTAFTDDKRKVMAQWAATVPESNWQMLVDYEIASATLNQLAATDPDTQSAAVTAAENALITALQNANSSPLLLSFVRSESARRSSLRDNAADSFPRRALSAMRSDF